MYASSEDVGLEIMSVGLRERWLSEVEDEESRVRWTGYLSWIRQAGHDDRGEESEVDNEGIN